MSKSLRDRPPRLEQLRVPRDEIDAALDQHPLLPDAAAPQLVGQREAARRVMPEQIVGDEHVIARPTRSPRQTRSIDRSRTERDRTAARSSRTSSGTDSRARSRSRYAGRCCRHAYWRRQPTTRCRAGSGTSSSTNGRLGSGVRTTAPCRPRSSQPGHVVERPPRVERVARAPARRARRRRGRPRRRRRSRNGAGYAAAVWPPTTIGTSGASARTRAGERARTSSVSSACMQAMPTRAGRTRRRDRLERTAEAQIERA